MVLTHPQMVRLLSTNPGYMWRVLLLFEKIQAPTACNHNVNMDGPQRISRSTASSPDVTMQLAVVAVAPVEQSDTGKWRNLAGNLTGRLNRL